MATDDGSVEGSAWPMPKFRFYLGTNNTPIRPPLARFIDFHECPMEAPVIVPIPHVGGPIVAPKTSSISVNGQPASLTGEILDSTHDNESQSIA